MPTNKVSEFNNYRSLMNDKILSGDNKIIKRIFNLDTNAFKEGVSKEEIMESLSIATLVGGTIVIPHLRRAYEFWEALEDNSK